MTSNRQRAHPEGRTPTGLPLLSAGAHLAPEDGACLMEYVSVLAGEPFSDTPRCTDPLLATLARLVNDATSDHGRDRLGALASALAGAHRTDAADQATLVFGTVHRVHGAVGPSRRLDRQLRRARRRMHRVVSRERAGDRTRWADLAHRRGSGRHRLIAAVDATAALPETVRDALLYDLLAAALSSACLRPARQQQIAEPPRSGHRWSPATCCGGSRS